MCYIKNPDTSTCSDKVASGSNPGKSWSYVACTPAPTPTNEKYFLSRKGGLCANIKTVTFSAVNTLKECKIAVATIQKTVSTAKFAAEETDANWPKGCYLYIVTNGVYFNKHSSGKTHDSARQICYDAISGTCKGDNDCGGKDSEESCVDGKCVCGDGTEGTGPSCIGNTAAPNCAKKDKLCKCGLKTAAVTSCASKKSAPVCFKNGILPAACSCGDQGICKDGSKCTKDANGKEQCTQQCPTVCPKNEECDTFHKVCRCFGNPSCEGYAKGPFCDKTDKKCKCSATVKACAKGKTCKLNAKGVKECA